MRKYVWPASALTEADMAALYRARQRSPTKTTIARLVAEAVRKVHAVSVIAETERKEAA